ncbi:hypothetical protein ABR965_16875 [Photorhabdus laumondii]|uniref:hypothetical protein n=1 Tax=Photorhabdus laumondii TaxID=2218628 RepID=UPI003314D123
MCKNHICFLLFELNRTTRAANNAHPPPLKAIPYQEMPCRDSSQRGTYCATGEIAGHKYGIKPTTGACSPASKINRIYVVIAKEAC